MSARQRQIDAIVARERAAGKDRTQALSIAMAEVGQKGNPASTTPIYDAAVAKAKKKGKKIPTAMD